PTASLPTNSEFDVRRSALNVRRSPAPPPGRSVLRKFFSARSRSKDGLADQAAEILCAEAGESGGGRAVWRSDLIAQDLRVDLLSRQQARGAQQGFDRELLGCFRSQPGGDAGIAQGGGKFEDVGWAASAHAGD